MYPFGTGMPVIIGMMKDWHLELLKGILSVQVFLSHDS